MTSFLDAEQSLNVSSPIELFDVRYGAVSWHYTSGDSSFFDEATARLYETLAIRRSRVVFSNDLTKGTLEVELQRDAPFLDLFRVAPPSGVVSLTVRRTHHTAAPGEIAVIWKGRILNVDWDASTATLMCEPIRTSAQRYGLRRCIQLQCPHVLYGPGCWAPKAAFELVATVGGISGSVVGVPAAVSEIENYYAGGYLEWTSSLIAATERRSIIASAAGSAQLTLIGVPLGLQVGDEVRVYPGCDHTLGPNGCQRFNNTPNFGGFPHTSVGANPFGGDTLF